MKHRTLLLAGTIVASPLIPLVSAFAQAPAHRDGSFLLAQAPEGEPRGRGGEGGPGGPGGPGGGRREGPGPQGGPQGGPPRGGPPPQAAPQAAPQQREAPPPRAEPREAPPRPEPREQRREAPPAPPAAREAPAPRDASPRDAGPRESGPRERAAPPAAQERREPPPPPAAAPERREAPRPDRDGPRPDRDGPRPDRDGPRATPPAPAPGTPPAPPAARPDAPPRPEGAPGQRPAAPAVPPSATQPAPQRLDAPTPPPSAPRGPGAPGAGERPDRAAPPPPPAAGTPPGTPPGTSPGTPPAAAPGTPPGAAPGTPPAPRAGGPGAPADQQRGLATPAPSLAPPAPGLAPQGQAGGRDRDGRFGDRRVEERDGRTYIRENDNRLIIRQGDREIIRHDEVERLRRGARDVDVFDRPGGQREIVVVRPDGDRIVTFVDEDGNLLRRVRRGRDGRDFVIIDNERNRPRGGGGGYFAPPVDLPPLRLSIPRERYIVEADEAPYDVIEETLLAPPVERVERAYSLDEVRYNQRLREKVRRVDIDTINFATGSAVVEPAEANRLDKIARALTDVIRRNPNEVFLVEGHTDAVGGDTENLSLSDRRAESVAAIMTERYQIPPENLVTQGYGEQYLKVQTQAAERQNRRVTLRRITPLLQQGQQQGTPR